MGGRDGIIIRDASFGVVPSLLGFDPMAQAGDAQRRTDIETWVSAGFALIAESERTIVGFVVTVPEQFFGRDFVALLIVHPDHRRRGVGTALLDAAVSGAGTSRVFTSTNVSNKPMKALLSSTGWAYSGTVDGLDPGDPEEFYYIDR